MQHWSAITLLRTGRRVAALARGDDQRGAAAQRGRDDSLIELADEYREREGWDVVMFLTDLPRRSGTEPVVADVSIRTQPR